MEFYPLLSASRFLEVADPSVLQGRIFYYPGELKEIKSIPLPISAVFGSKDEYQSNPNEKLKILKKNIENCEAKSIKNASYSFAGYELELSKLIRSWLEKQIFFENFLKKNFQKQ